LPINLVLPGHDALIPALLLDVSHLGLFIKGSSDVRLSAQVLVRFRLRPKGWCEAKGTIVRRTQVVRIHGFAVQFDEVNEAWAELVEDAALLTDGERPLFVAQVLGPVIEVLAG